MVVVTGGFVTTALGVRLSARSPLPALSAAACCLAIWFVVARRARAVAEDIEHTDAWLDRHVRGIVSLIAALAGIAAIAFNSFSATGSDASGYLSHAEMLLEGKLSHAEPLASIAKWHDGEATLAPLGWRAVGDGTQVPTYSVGLPLLMAPLHAAGGVTAASLVAPLSFVLSIVLIAALAYRVAGAPAAIVAATWLSTSPVALVESMQVMSDVPVTAAWMLCWWLVFTNRPLGAGLAAAVAVLIRPNLAPLVALPALVVLTRNEGSEGRRFSSGAQRSVSSARRGLAFVIPVAIAGIITAYLQWRWFGSPLRSGYGAANEIYAVANLAPNTALYAGWLVDTHGPWLFAAPLALFFRSAEYLPRRSARTGTLASEPRWLLAFALAVVAAYLLYAQFEVWTYLRFLLPALAIAMIAVAAVVARSLNRIAVTMCVPILAVIVLALAFSNIAAAKRLDVFRFAERHVRARVVADRLSPILPANAVIVSGEQSGAMRYYTGRTILRWDLVDEAALRDAMDWLTLNAYQVWVVLDDWEEEAFRRKLPALSSISLDYEPTVESAVGVGIRTRAWRARTLIARSSNNE